MGLLQNFTLPSETQVFIETGTGNGDSLAYAIKHNFKHLYSIEIDATCACNAAKKFEDDVRTMVLCGSSHKTLPKIIRNHKEPILFWLDAHFPGEMHGVSYDNEKNMSLRLPLESELVIIKENRDTSKDYFIIDDLRIYEDGPFKSGVWKDRQAMGGDGIDFIYRLFQDTHTIVRDYRNEGYIILTPYV